MSSSEAEERWGLRPGTVRASCTRGKLKDHTGVRKSGNTWLVTEQAMKDMYREEKKMEIMLSSDPIVEKYLKLALESGAPFTYNDTRFINIKFLYDFVKRHEKHDFIDFEEVIKEVITAAGLDASYELGSHETKSGNPEVLSFDVEYDIDEETGDVENYTIEF
jgi:hypothetical protein